MPSSTRTELPFHTACRSPTSRRSPFAIYAARLHRASKTAPRVAVYTHKDPEQLLGRLAGERIHRAEAVELYAIDRRLLGAIAARLERRMAFALSVAEHELYVSLGTDTLTGVIARHALDQSG